MIVPYLRDMINDHKVSIKSKVCSRYKVIDYESHFEEWKIQLTMQINFISSNDSEDIRTMSTKSNNIEIMMDSETEILLKNFSNLFCKDINMDYKNR